ncbi:Ger(x)C family spore germination protein [Natranaerofaba carboxydovora]|uniref:Ger(x)C family spore germination protein n=1 Tax=Natranaerofaba carboxydovora TaxID=2742683 RepID=UPI001F1411D9|nr:Ger(x)C family spore germination protein [Natranaerofaba carboxydovora]UMZ74119.1 Spore germination protein B3 [Natranaerofaba carboxydovora]
MKKINKKSKVLIILISLSMSLNLSGCWDSLDIENRVLVKMIGIDTAKEDDRVEVTVQLIEIEGAGEEGEAGQDFITVSTTAYTIEEAIKGIRRKTGRELYLGYNQVIIFGHELAEEGVEEQLDFFLRHPDINIRNHLYVAHEEASEIIETPHLIEELPARTLELHILMDKGRHYIADLREYMMALLNETSDPMMGHIMKEEGDEEEESFEVLSGSLFKEDKFASFFVFKESRGVNWVLNPRRVDGAVTIQNPFDEEKGLSIDILDAKSEVSYENTTPDELKASIEVSVVGRLSENQVRRYQIDTTENIQQLNHRVSQSVANEVIAALEVSQEHEADIFGFGDLLYRTAPDIYYKLKDDWDEVYEDLEVAVEVETEIRRPGLRR